MPSERLKKIIEENAEFEKTAPYNFCDRWCERCPHQTQARCPIYKDELEQKLTCIAHGRDENDPQVTEEVLGWQYNAMEELLEENLEEIDLDQVDEEVWGPVKKHIQFVEENSFSQTADKYTQYAHVFLEATFRKSDLYDMPKDLIRDFETISWYHTLLSAKLHRALAGFHEPMAEGDVSMCDAVAQFAVCKKAVQNSTESLKRLVVLFPEHQPAVRDMIVLLQNILDRIGVMEDSIR